MPIFFIDLGGRTHSRRVETAFMGLPLSEGSMSQLNTDTSVSFQDGKSLTLDGRLVLTSPVLAGM